MDARLELGPTPGRLAELEAAVVEAEQSYLEAAVTDDGRGRVAPHPAKRQHPPEAVSAGRDQYGEHDDWLSTCPRISVGTGPRRMTTMDKSWSVFDWLFETRSPRGSLDTRGRAWVDLASAMALAALRNLLPLWMVVGMPGPWHVARPGRQRRRQPAPNRAGCGGGWSRAGDPIRIAFEAVEGSALIATLIDLGDRFRMIIDEVVASEPPPMPDLPVARSHCE